MTTYAWRDLLQRWRDAWLRHEQEGAEPLPEEVRRALRLGTRPADPAEVGALEERLGAELPPSYRQFLLTSDGWGPATYEIERVLPVREVGWTSGFLPHALKVAGSPDSDDLYLLDPRVVGPDGEWEAWHVVHHPAGAAFRHRSFWDLMNGESLSFAAQLTRWG
ncbi:hypothetical protein RKD23_007075 [Streptomyces sp. SAI-170]|uniref:SMI1/KNR4 family protein n=1 Tax=Streptomyces sp. SAI-170 TaxID=3377729 RepID=UPI003C7A6428